VVISTATLDDFSESKGAQRGGFGYANAVTTDTAKPIDTPRR
jgi:hypothetical protein